MKKRSILLASVMALSLIGCSSSSYEDIAKDQAKAKEVRQEAMEKQAALEQEKVESYLKQVPDWVINPPKADGYGFYASGIGTSKDLTLSLAKGTMQAEFNLAKSYSQVLSANEKAFKKEDYDKYVQVIDTFIDKVDLTGYSTIERVVSPIDGVINTYVLLKMPFEVFNQEMRNKVVGDIEAQNAFEELQERIKETVQ